MKLRAVFYDHMSTNARMSVPDVHFTSISPMKQGGFGLIVKKSYFCGELKSGMGARIGHLVWIYKER